MCLDRYTDAMTPAPHRLYVISCDCCYSKGSWHPFEAVEDAVVQKTTHLSKSYDNHRQCRHQNPSPPIIPIVIQKKR